MKLCIFVRKITKVTGISQCVIQEAYVSFDPMNKVMTTCSLHCEVTVVFFVGENFRLCRHPVSHQTSACLIVWWWFLPESVIHVLAAKSSFLPYVLISWRSTRLAGSVVEHTTPDLGVVSWCSRSFFFASVYLFINIESCVLTLLTFFSFFIVLKYT